MQVVSFQIAGNPKNVVFLCCFSHREVATTQWENSQKKSNSLRILYYLMQSYVSKKCVSGSHPNTPPVVHMTGFASSHELIVNTP